MSFLKKYKKQFDDAKEKYLPDEKKEVKTEEKREETPAGAQIPVSILQAVVLTNTHRAWHQRSSSLPKPYSSRSSWLDCTMGSSQQPLELP